MNATDFGSNISIVSGSSKEKTNPVKISIARNLTILDRFTNMGGCISSL
ncbi:hypothetical protein [uncultured Methanobrevibacter sp.]|nr:hypothetical protein [uncultured Methanobrevibacter sp.]